MGKFRSGNKVSGIFLVIFAGVLLSNIQICSCYGWRSSTELWDLEFNDERFLTEVSAWTASSLINQNIKSYICDKTYVMGGYNVLGGTKDQYFERTFTDLPPHNQLNLRYTVYPIDSWDGASVDDHYQVKVDDYSQKGWSFVHTSGNEVAKCGSSSWPEYPPVLAISTFIHSASSVKIRFINMLNQPSNDESLGIRDIKMEFVNVATPQYSLCGRSTADKPLLAWPCQGCDSSHQYQNLNSNGLSTSGACFECSESCATCNSAGCTTCYTANYLEGSACKQCTNGCATCNSATYCLTCQSNLYMAANGCYSTCKYPLYVTESAGMSYCNSPCSGSQYAMWDGSCSDTCPTTQLTDTKMASYKVCTFPCSINPIAA